MDAAAAFIDAAHRDDAAPAVVGGNDFGAGGEDAGDHPVAGGDNNNARPAANAAADPGSPENVMKEAEKLLLPLVARFPFLSNLPNLLELLAAKYASLTPQQRAALRNKAVRMRNELVKYFSHEVFPVALTANLTLASPIAKGLKQTDDIKRQLGDIASSNSPLQLLSLDWVRATMSSNPKFRVRVADASLHSLVSFLWLLTGFLNGTDCSRDHYLRCFVELRDDLINRSGKGDCGVFTSERIEELRRNSERVRDRILQNDEQIREHMGLPPPPPAAAAAAAAAPPPPPPAAPDEATIVRSIVDLYDVTEEEVRQFFATKRRRF